MRGRGGQWKKASPPGHEILRGGLWIGRTGGDRGVVGTDLRAHPTAHMLSKELNQWIFG
jgi:hypothetical protein